VRTSDFAVSGPEGLRPRRAGSRRVAELGLRRGRRVPDASDTLVAEPRCRCGALRRSRRAPPGRLLWPRRGRLARTLTARGKRWAGSGDPVPRRSHVPRRHTRDATAPPERGPLRPRAGNSLGVAVVGRRDGSRCRGRLGPRQRSATVFPRMRIAGPAAAEIVIVPRIESPGSRRSSDCARAAVELKVRSTQPSLEGTRLYGRDRTPAARSSPSSPAAFEDDRVLERTRDLRDERDRG